MNPADGKEPCIGEAAPVGEAKWWETAEDHRFALEVLQLGLRRRMLKFIGPGTKTLDEVAREFGIKAELAEYHLALLEKALVIERIDGSYRSTLTGRAYLENVKSRQ
ncbi:MAG TPA: hypothetical protein VN455_06400 [Methanotrichaceae archaeon]|nr:hypothetical protein [Methanotrichaceae archaeon]